MIAVAEITFVPKFGGKHSVVHRALSPKLREKISKEKQKKSKQIRRKLSMQPNAYVI